MVFAVSFFGDSLWLLCSIFLAFSVSLIFFGFSHVFEAAMEIFFAVSIISPVTFGVVVSDVIVTVSEIIVVVVFAIVDIVVDNGGVVEDVIVVVVVVVVVVVFVVVLVVVVVVVVVVMSFL